MNLYIKISALPVKGGKFLPKFGFMEFEGAQITTIPYNFGVESIRDTKEEALNVAKIQAFKEAKNKYGSEIQVFLSEE